MSQIIVAYGFEYDALIVTRDYVLCKCIDTKNPFYALPHTLIGVSGGKSPNFEGRSEKFQSSDLESINVRVEEIGWTQQFKDLVGKMREFVQYRHMGGIDLALGWKVVLYHEYSSQLRFNHLDINYESEGDENGDGR